MTQEIKGYIPWSKEKCEEKISETRERVNDYYREVNAIDRQINFLNDRRAALLRMIGKAQQYINVVKTQMDDKDAPKWTEI